MKTLKDRLTENNKNFKNYAIDRAECLIDEGMTLVDTDLYTDKETSFCFGVSKNNTEIGQVVIDIEKEREFVYMNDRLVFYSAPGVKDYRENYSLISSGSMRVRHVDFSNREDDLTREVICDTTITEVHSGYNRYVIKDRYTSEVLFVLDYDTAHKLVQYGARGYYAGCYDAYVGDNKFMDLSHIEKALNLMNKN